MSLITLAYRCTTFGYSRQTFYTTCCAIGLCGVASRGWSFRNLRG
jgi:hypothetical protein